MANEKPIACVRRPALWVWGLTVLLCLFSSGAPADQAAYKIKAVFLFNFVKYTQWPDEAGEGNIYIGVLGQNSFGGCSSGP